jgi:hypothetical protein
MNHDEFRIGLHFLCGGKCWRCTDVGTRTIVAIALGHPDDPSWYHGPPYAVAEMVFDEEDLLACEATDLSVHPAFAGPGHKV